MGEQVLSVRTHVARDLLHSAGLFKNEHLVVWEYVSNGLQYIDEGTKPVVRVRIEPRKKRITVKDNGRGMLWDDLANFFVMHGENIERLEGRAGRGRFGTGKSAALGIADTLRITTVRNGKRSKVSITRADIEGMCDGSPIPVQTIEREAPTKETNGTLVEIENVRLRSIEPRRVIKYVERHLARWPKNVTVWVNNHECQYTEPVAVKTVSILPTSEFRQVLGDQTLTLRVSASPLDPDMRGVSVYSKGIWHENTLAGCDGKEMSNYIFGDIDVPALDEDDGPVAAFDVSRSMTLNPKNDVVTALYAFLGANIEKLRKELVDQERERKRTEESKRLAREADEIAKLLNEDFADYRRQLVQTKAKLKGAHDAGPTEEGGETGEDLIFGGELPAAQIAETGSPGSEGEQETQNSDTSRDLLPQVAEDETAPPQGKPAGSDGKGKRRPRGGFGVDFRQMGEDAQRAAYDRDSRIIAINLDHPQFDSKLDRSARIEDPSFRKLTYEIAVTEYAFALAYELAAVGHFGGEETDALYEVQEVLDRVIRRAARVHKN